MLLVANYKMNGDFKFYATTIQKLNKVKDTNIVLCPPFVFLPQFKNNLKFHNLGAQNVDCPLNNKSTGGISAQMLKEFGCAYTLVGHSERRAYETEQDIAQKIIAAQKQNIIPIVCVGEKYRGQGYLNFISQVESALKVADKNKQIIFAYEPVWSIGSGNLPSRAHVENIIKKIKASAEKFGFNVPVIYGGSINENNFGDYMGVVDGFLVGGLALDTDRFILLIRRVYGK